MNVDIESRQATLSVREFSLLGHVPDTGSTLANIWRAASGSAWHERLRQTAQASNPDTVFEIPVQGVWMEAGWRLHLQGRIDQMESLPSHTLLREIKTTSLPLPLPEGTLEAQLPHAFLQLATYVHLTLTGTPGLSCLGELLLVHEASGTQQRCTLSAEKACLLFRTQATQAVQGLAARERHRRQWRGTHFLPPFPQGLRPGQAEARQALGRHIGLSPFLFFEAPTGFGKTALALEHALTLLREGQAERLLYLTGKKTGQLAVMQALKALRPPGSPLRYVRLRSQEEHALATPLLTPVSPARKGRTVWQATGLTPESLFHEGTLDHEALLKTGEQAGLAPYALTLACLDLADIWICDYNYLCSPSHRSVLESQPSYCPSNTVLIVDEAHLLPERVQAALSGSLSWPEAHALLLALERLSCAPQLRIVWSDLVQLLETLPPCAALPPPVEGALTGLLSRLAAAVRAEPLPWRQMDGDTLDTLQQTLSLNSNLQHKGLTPLLWAPQAGVLQLSCLEARQHLAQTLRPFQRTLLMSATLSPFEDFAETCGLHDTPWDTLRAEAPWRLGAYDIAIDTRVDTRLKTRAQHYATTAATLRLMRAHAQRGPVAAFFPSYRYAETLAEYLRCEDPLWHTAIQPRHATAEEQEAFMESALPTADALFLILGGSLAESVDLLGGRLTHALVIGPALPEVHPVREAQLDLLCRKHSRQQAFERLYIQPGMRKINQALGRLVRAPGQSARVLLHCRRFADPAYGQHLAPEYRQDRLLTDTPALHAWLEHAPCT